MKTDCFTIRQIVRLLLVEKLGNREISRRLKVPSSTVSKYKKLTDCCCISFDELNAFEDKKFLDTLRQRDSVVYLKPDFEEIERIRRSHKRMTLEKAFDLSYFSQSLQKGESFYSLAHLYDLFDEWYQEFHGKPKISKIPCNPGDRLEIDFVGDILHWIDGNGQKHEARVFSAAYRYSNFIYAEAFEDMTKTSWLTGIVHTLEAYGVPRSIGFDNDKSLVKKPDVYIAELSAAMRELCDYYGIDPSSCRIKKPSHKGVVEGSCGIIEKEAYVDLEGFTGYMYAKDLDDVNQKLRDKVDSINEKPFVINGKGSRKLNFDKYEKRELKRCPSIAYEICEWKILRVDKYGWVKVDENKRYLVHYLQRNKEVICKLSSTSVRFYSKDKHIDCGCYDRRYSTEYESISKPEYYDPTERAITKGFQETLGEFESLGYALANIVGYLRSVFNSESSTAITNYKKVMGIKGLCKKHGAKIVDEGCKVAAEANQTSNYELIKSYIIDSIYKINEKKSKYKVDKDKDYPKESGKSEVGVKLRGAESYSGGAQHE